MKSYVVTQDPIEPPPSEDLAAHVQDALAARALHNAGLGPELTQVQWLAVTEDYLDWLFPLGVSPEHPEYPERLGRWAETSTAKHADRVATFGTRPRVPDSDD